MFMSVCPFSNFSSSSSSTKFRGTTMTSPLPPDITPRGCGLAGNGAGLRHTSLGLNRERAGGPGGRGACRGAPQGAGRGGGLWHQCLLFPWNSRTTAAARAVPRRATKLGPRHAFPRGPPKWQSARAVGRRSSSSIRDRSHAIACAHRVSFRQAAPQSGRAHVSSAMKVLVTGGAGYIGSHTVLEMLEAGYALRRPRTLSPSPSTALAPAQLARARGARPPPVPARATRSPVRAPAATRWS